MITFIKFLVIIIINMFLGMLPFFVALGFLFYPSQQLKWFGKKVPLTPAYAYRKKKQLISKLHRYFYEYIKDCKNVDNTTKIAQWEDKAFHAAYDKLQFISDFRWLPGFIKHPVHEFIANLCYQVVSQFFRKLVPWLMDKYELTNYIELLDKKLDVTIVREFLMKKLFKYIIIVLVIFYGLIGLFNGFIFLILK